MQEKAGPFTKILIDGIAKNKFGINTITSAKWLRRKAQGLGKRVRQGQLLGDSRRITDTLRPGSMLFMHYDPKHKKTLPYYDRYPMFIMVDFTADGFYGLNLHYLPLTQRALLLDNLFKTLTNVKFNETTRMKISYSMLKSSSNLKGFAPCFKQYLWGHVMEGPVFIHPVEWNICMMLPLQRFIKASTAKVYADSRKIMAGL